MELYNNRLDAANGLVVGMALSLALWMLIGVICPPLSGPETMIVWTTKGTLNAKQEAQAGRDHRQAT
ncbi:hypothetical protein SPH9361_04991 [Sphingobium sp. CECT 9361]|nr:hypothetical protein SPH9361_04991 [Sphingobium sp. CECT 9361]